MNKRPKGVGDRRFVTIGEIATELRVRIPTLRESGILAHCRRIPAGTLGRFELWLWEDVQDAVLSIGSEQTHPPTTSRRRERPVGSFVQL